MKYQEGIDAELEVREEEVDSIKVVCSGTRNHERKLTGVQFSLLIMLSTMLLAKFRLPSYMGAHCVDRVLMRCGRSAHNFLQLRLHCKIVLTGPRTPTTINDAHRSHFTHPSSTRSSHNKSITLLTYDLGSVAAELPLSTPDSV